MMVSGWVHCHQMIVIEFLPAENRLLQGGCADGESDSPMLSVLFWRARRRR
jgi:hypothetical protein